MLIRASFDDGCKEDVRLAELLLKYGITATFYIPAKWKEHNEREGREPLSMDDFKFIAENFEIGSHTINHPMLTRIPIELARKEIIESKDMLSNLIHRGVTSFCAPRGYSNPDLQAIIGEHYETARNTLVGTIEPPDDPLWQSTTVHIAGKRRPEYESTTWLNEARRLLHEARQKEDSVYHFWGHSWEMTRYNAWGDFETLLQELTDEDLYS